MNRIKREFYDKYIGNLDRETRVSKREKKAAKIGFFPNCYKLFKKIISKFQDT